MRGEMLDLCTICLGPFDMEIKDMDVILSSLSTSNNDKRVPVIRNIWSLKNFEEQILENDPENEEIITQVKEWTKITNVDASGAEISKWYLVVHFDKIELYEQLKVAGDFRIQVKSSKGATFYFWLNVSAISYNQ